MCVQEVTKSVGNILVFIGKGGRHIYDISSLMDSAYRLSEQYLKISSFKLQMKILISHEVNCYCCKRDVVDDLSGTDNPLPWVHYLIKGAFNIGGSASSGIRAMVLTVERNRGEHLIRRFAERGNETDPRDDDGIEDVNPFGGGNPGFHDDHYDNPLLEKEIESEPIIWDIGDEEEEYPFVNKYPSFQEEPIVLMEEESCLVYDADNKEEESMPVYDTDIEDVIEEEEGFVGKGGFGGLENIEDIVVVANDICSSMIQTILSVDIEEDINTKSHELMSFGKSIIIKRTYRVSGKKEMCNCITVTHAALCSGRRIDAGMITDIEKSLKGGRICWERGGVDFEEASIQNARVDVVLGKEYSYQGDTNLDATSTRDE
ncbi:hypothetical protein Tco_1475290 [Tanacetum coccineum]